jgi:hypothetical protein
VPVKNFFPLFFATTPKKPIHIFIWFFEVWIKTVEEWVGRVEWRKFRTLNQEFLGDTEKKIFFLDDGKCDKRMKGFLEDGKEKGGMV